MPYFSRTFLFVAIVIVSAASLSACGWQLRGYQQYKAGNIENIGAVNLRNTADNRLFQSTLKKQLADLGISLSNDADITLVVNKEHTERRPLSYSSTGITVQYQLIMTISYAHARAPDNVMIERELIARRQYDFDTALVVAKKEEERTLLQEMREELVTRIIASLSSNPAAH